MSRRDKLLRNVSILEQGGSPADPKSPLAESRAAPQSTAMKPLSTDVKQPNGASAISHLGINRSRTTSDDSDKKMTKGSKPRRPVVTAAAVAIRAWRVERLCAPKQASRDTKLWAAALLARHHGREACLSPWRRVALLDGRWTSSLCRR